MTLLVGPLMLRRADPRLLAGPALMGCDRLLDARLGARRRWSRMTSPWCWPPSLRADIKNPPMDTRINGRGTLGGRAGRRSRS